MDETMFEDAKTVSLKAGATVFEPGDPCNMFVILKEGKIRVDLLSASGKPVTLYHFGAGETCILTTSCLMSNEPLIGEATVVEPVVAYVYSPSEFETKLDNSSEFRRFVFTAFASRLSTMMSKIDNVMTVSVEARLALVLLELFQEKDAAHATQEELAREVGTAREVVSRKLAIWRDAGIIRSKRGTLELLDRKALQKFSQNRD